MKGVQDAGSIPAVSTLVYLLSVLRWGRPGFDWAISKDTDNTVGDDRKSSKTRKCKRIYKWYC